MVSLIITQFRNINILNCHTYILIIPFGHVEQEHHGNGGTVVNRKDGGLLGLGGATFIGDSNRFVTCAPRWSNQRGNRIDPTSHYFMNGICYWRPKDQIIQDFVPSLLSNHTLIPLRDKGICNAYIRLIKHS